MSLTAVAAGTDSPGLSKRDLALALCVVLPLAAIIAPYRHVHLPPIFILGIAAIGGLLCLKAAIEDPETLLFVFLLYIPFHKVLAGDFGGRIKAFNFTNALMFLLVLGWLARIMVEKRAPRHARSAQTKVVALFLMITSISIAAEAVRASGDIRYVILSDLKRWLASIAVYFLVVAIGRSTTTAKRMFLAVLVTTAVIGLIGVKQFWMDMGGGARSNFHGIRIAVTSGPSNLGAFFAYYLPYYVALLISNIWHPVYWFLIVPTIWCLDALRTTFSRGAVLAFAAAALAVLFKKSKLAFVAMAVLVMVALQGGGIRLPSSIFGRMASTYEADRPGEGVAEKLDTSSRTRLVIWEGAIEMIRDNPLFGVGYGRFPAEIGRYRGEVADMDPHNNFLKIGAEMGLPALAAFILMLLVCLWRAWRLYGRVEDPLLKVILLGYCGSVVAVFIANIFGSRLDSAEITTQFWAMTGGIVLIERHHEDERRQRMRVLGLSDADGDEDADDALAEGEGAYA